MQVIPWVGIKYPSSADKPADIRIYRSSAVFPALISGSGHSEYNSPSIPLIRCRPPRS